MTPAQHYAEAERLLVDASAMSPSNDWARFRVAHAHVHATLATATDAAEMLRIQGALGEIERALRNPIAASAIDDAQQVIEQYRAGDPS